MDATAIEGNRVVGCGHSFTSEMAEAKLPRPSTAPLYRNTAPLTNHGLASSKWALSTPRDAPLLSTKQTPAVGSQPPTMAPKQLWTASHP
jgi:hypothetical protein